MLDFIRIPRNILGFILIILTCDLAYSTEAEKSFAIKGAGAVSCERFVTALSENSTEHVAFASWIDGYITAFNQFQPETFDIAPWQSTLLLTQSLGRHCKKNPTEPFFRAITMMLQALYGKRLQKQSEIVKIQSNDKVLFIYKEIVELIQINLNKQNKANIRVDGNFGRNTESELRAFQKQKNIPATGIPDQITLQILLRS